MPDTFAIEPKRRLAKETERADGDSVSPLPIEDPQQLVSLRVLRSWLRIRGAKDIANKTDRNGGITCDVSHTLTSRSLIGLDARTTCAHYHSHLQSFSVSEPCRRRALSNLEDVHALG